MHFHALHNAINTVTLSNPNGNDDNCCVLFKNMNLFIHFIVQLFPPNIADQEQTEEKATGMDTGPGRPDVSPEPTVQGSSFTERNVRSVYNLVNEDENTS